MPEQKPLSSSHQLPAESMPSWWKGGGATQRDRVARGLHPTGERLGFPGQTCGGCAKISLHDWTSHPWWECAHMARGRAFAVRKKWPACTEWVPPTLDSWLRGGPWDSMIDDFQAAVRSLGTDPSPEWVEAYVHLTLTERGLR